MRKKRNDRRKSEMRKKTRQSGRRIPGRGTMMRTGGEATLRNVRGEAVVILMAAMMAGGFLLWMAAGHFHGKHGGRHDAAASRPAVAGDPDRESRRGGAGRGGTRGWASEESVEMDRGGREHHEDV